MKNKFTRALKNIGLDDISIAIFNREIDLEHLIYDQNPPLYGFTPALIPLVRNGAGYIGYWNHFWVERNKTIVFQDPESSYYPYERWRNTTQFTVEILHDFIDPIIEELYDDFESQPTEQWVTNPMLGKCKQLGLPNSILLELLDLMIAEGPQGPSIFQKMSCFKNDPPRNLKALTYLSDHPSVTGHFVKPYDSYCGLEIYPGTHVNQSDLPPWFDRHAPKKPLFEKFLAKHDFRSAWLTLNSPGWDFGDAKVAMIELAKEAKDETFSTWTEFWTSLEHENYNCY